ncbi:hypothetical protein ACTJKC_01855 [Pedobacter sp. 22226]|uniref:hypothetical protein n=1 Tax=Pedobacter sp. 22226 TaxID=3453894 RepID=UPI003F82DAB5
MLKQFIIAFLLLTAVTQLQAQQQIGEKQLFGKWKYDIAYDTIAVSIDTSHFHSLRKEQWFFTDITIKKDRAILFDTQEKWSPRWEIKNKDELYFYLDNNKTLSYRITRLTGRKLELKAMEEPASTIGYIR